MLLKQRNQTNHIAVCKQITIIKWKWLHETILLLFVFHRNTWKYKTVCKLVGWISETKPNDFKSFRVFGQLSLSLLLYSKCFDRCVLRPSTGISCRTREPTRNFEPRPFFNPRGSLALIPLSITRYKYFYIVIRLQSGLNLQHPIDCHLEVNAYN